MTKDEFLGLKQMGDKPEALMERAKSGNNA
jgi:hypothetical protein